LILLKLEVLISVRYNFFVLLYIKRFRTNNWVLVSQHFILDESQSPHISWLQVIHVTYLCKW